MKFSTTPILLASMVFAAPALTAPVFKSTANSAQSERSPAMALEMLGVASPATREGSGSRHSIPVYRKRALTNASPPTQGLSGLGFNIATAVFDAGDIEFSHDGTAVSHSVPTDIPDLSDELTPTLTSVRLAEAAASTLPGLPLEDVYIAVDEAAEPIDDLVDEDATPKPSATQVFVAKDYDSLDKRYELAPSQWPEPFAAAEGVLSSAMSLASDSSATDAGIPTIVVSDTASEHTSAASMFLSWKSSSITTTPSSATQTKSVQESIETITGLPSKHHFNPFLDDAPFSVVPAEQRRPGWVYADDVDTVQEAEGNYQAQTISPETRRSSVQSRSLTAETSSSTSASASSLV